RSAVLDFYSIFSRLSDQVHFSGESLGQRRSGTAANFFVQHWQPVQVIKERSITEIAACQPILGINQALTDKGRQMLCLRSGRQHVWDKQHVHVSGLGSTNTGMSVFKNQRVGRIDS